MEGSVGSRNGRSPIQASSAACSHAGLSPKAGAAWDKPLNFSGKYKRDVAEASKFWSEGASAA